MKKIQITSGGIFLTHTIQRRSDRDIYSLLVNIIRRLLRDRTIMTQTSDRPVTQRDRQLAKIRRSCGVTYIVLFCFYSKFNILGRIDPDG